MITTARMCEDQSYTGGGMIVFGSLWCFWMQPELCNGRANNITVTTMAQFEAKFSQKVLNLMKNNALENTKLPSLNCQRVQRPTSP